MWSSLNTSYTGTDTLPQDRISGRKQDELFLSLYLPLGALLKWSSLSLSPSLLSFLYLCDISSYKKQCSLIFYLQKPNTISGKHFFRMHLLTFVFVRAGDQTEEKERVGNKWSKLELNPSKDLELVYGACSQPDEPVGTQESIC